MGELPNSHGRTLTDKSFVIHGIRTQIRPSAINNRGQIVGTRDPSNPCCGGSNRAFLYENGVMKDLGAPYGYSDSLAYDINDKGQIVGYSYDVAGYYHATLWQPTFTPPRTGQTKCYDTAGTEIACAGTGQDGEIQAGVAWPEPRFMDNGDGIVTDNLTGLMWTQEAGTPTVGSCSGGLKTWQDALDYIACLNSNNYLEHNDWRLPNINELRSLVHSGYNEQSCGGAPCVDMSDWLNSKGFSNVQFDYYWSSTTYADDTSYDTHDAWIVSMWDGYVYYVYKTHNYYVWPVRGGQYDSPDSIYPTNIWKTGQTVSYATGDDGDLERGVAWLLPRFYDNGNGTVTDNLTGLVWLKNANCTDTMGGVEKGSGNLTWSNALTWSNSLASGACGLTDGSTAGDWRLPNREELESLIDFSRFNPALPAGHPFSNVQSNYYWSSTTSASFTVFAWAVYLWNGYVPNGYKPNHAYVWPVRNLIEYVAVPDISVSPVSLNFGQVVKGDSSTQTITISNTGTAKLVISSIGFGQTGDTGVFFAGVGGRPNQCASFTPTIPEGGNCTIDVTFSPTSAGTKNANLTINSDDPDTPTVSVSLTGIGVIPLTLFSPNGGEVMHSGSNYNIRWNASPEVVKFDLKYSMNNGIAGSWKTIANKVPGTSYNWKVPRPVNNKTKCLVKVIGYNASGVRVGQDTSDKTFTIKVVEVVSPSKGETLTSGDGVPNSDDEWLIIWNAYMTIRNVQYFALYYSLTGTAPWTKIANTFTLSPPYPGDPDWFIWEVPKVRTTKTTCKVKVVLMDAGGIIVGSGVSDGFFTINP